MLGEFLPTDVLLLRIQDASERVGPIIQRLMALPAWQELSCTIARRAWATHSGIFYIYIRLPSRLALSKRMADSLLEAASPDISMTVSRLALMQQIEGASQGEVALFHYVVETTPAAG